MSSNVSCDSTAPLRRTNGNPEVAAEHQVNLSKNKRDQWAGFFKEGGYLWENIDTSKAVWPLATWCFLTGYMSVFLLHLGRKNLFRLKIIIIQGYRCILCHLRLV